MPFWDPPQSETGNGKADVESSFDHHFEVENDQIEGVCTLEIPQETANSVPKMPFQPRKSIKMSSFWTFSSPNKSTFFFDILLDLWAIFPGGGGGRKWHLSDFKMTLFGFRGSEALFLV